SCGTRASFSSKDSCAKKRARNCPKGTASIVWPCLDAVKHVTASGIAGCFDRLAAGCSRIQRGGGAVLFGGSPAPERRHEIAHEQGHAGPEVCTEVVRLAHRGIPFHLAQLAISVGVLIAFRRRVKTDQPGTLTQHAVRRSKNGRAPSQDK